MFPVLTSSIHGLYLASGAFGSQVHIFILWVKWEGQKLTKGYFQRSANHMLEYE